MMANQWIIKDSFLDKFDIKYLPVFSFPFNKHISMWL